MSNHTVTPQDTPSTSQKTASQSKLENILTDTPKQSDSHITGYRIIDMEILSELINQLRCPKCCADSLKFHEKLVRKKGMASLLFLACDSEGCDYEKEFYTSKKSDNRNFFDVNMRTVYAMRSIGEVFASIERFSTMMNLPKPMTSKTYTNLVSSLLDAKREVAEDTMMDAANDLRKGSSEEVVDVGISADGSWQQQGYFH